MNGMLEEMDNALQVELHTMDGTASVLEVERGCTASDLKREIAEMRNIPEEYLQLIMGADILDNTVVLGTSESDKGTISVVLNLNLIISPEELYDQLERSSDMNVIIHAMQTLSKKSDVGDERLITAVSARLQEPWHSVAKLHAIEVLGKIANIGNECAISALLSTFKERRAPCCFHVQQEAAKVLSDIAGKGHQRAIKGLLTLIANEFVGDWCVATTKILASKWSNASNGIILYLSLLLKIVGEGDELVIDLMVYLVEHPAAEGAVRSAAQKVLEQARHEVNAASGC